MHPGVSTVALSVEGAVKDFNFYMFSHIVISRVTVTVIVAIVNVIVIVIVTLGIVKGLPGPLRADSRC